MIVLYLAAAIAFFPAGPIPIFRKSNRVRVQLFVSSCAKVRAPLSPSVLAVADMTRVDGAYPMERLARVGWLCNMLHRPCPKGLEFGNVLFQSLHEMLLISITGLIAVL